MTGGDGASFNYVDYGQTGSRQPDVEPVRRPARRVGGAQTPPTAEGGALRAQDLRTARRPGRPQRLGAPRRTRRPAPRCRTTRSAASADPNARRIVAYGLPQPVPVHDPPGHERALDRRRRLGHVGGDRPHRRTRPHPASATSAGRATRAPADQAGYDSAEPQHLREPVRARPGAVTAPYFTYNHGAKVVAGETLPDRAAPRSPGSPSTERRQLPGGLQRRAVLRGLLAQLHLGDVTRAANGLPDPSNDRRPSSRAPASPVDLEIGPGRRPLLRRPRRRHDPPHPATSPATARRPRRQREPDERRRAADRHLRRQRLERPGCGRHAHLRVGPRRRRRLRRLDRRRSRRSRYTTAGTVTGRGCG